MVEMLRGDVAADELCETLRGQVAGLMKDHGLTPGLAVVLVGDDPASAIYVRRKLQRSSEVGIRSFERRMPASATEAELLAMVEELNQNPDVHGILVQLPLPPQIDAGRVLDAIDPTKDVDGFHPVNVGRLSTGTGGLVPCTPLGVMRLLDRVVPDYAGLEAVVIGRSNIVGKPVALLLLERGCTVTIAHSQTRDLSLVVARADVVVAAAGRPGLIRGEWIKTGAVVIDVGINRVEAPDGRAKIVGDVSASELKHAAYLSPVPGGVGPLTIACLLANTVKAARERAKV